jgi:hypothetical protein
MFRRNPFFLVILFVVFSICLTNAQSITGTIFSSSNNPQVGALVNIGGSEAVTNSSGVFRIYDLPLGSYTMKVEFDGNEYTRGRITIREESIDLGDMRLVGKRILLKEEATTETLDEPKSTTTIAEDDENRDALDSDDVADMQLDIAVITISADDGGDGGQGSQYSSLLTAGRDPFNAAAAFNFSSGRFYARGYNNEDRHVFLNGFAVNDLDDGRVSWAVWGGLNDVLRNQTENNTLQANSFGFGGVGGANFIDTRASLQRPGTRIVYNHSNRAYTNRLMVTHNSGEQENGWSYSLSASRRWGDSGYIKGTFYDAYALFASVEKKINDSHSLGLTVLNSPSSRGRFSGSVQEAYDLAGSNYYNANWGYQNGKVRNSRINNSNQPIGILRHDWKINDKLSLRSTAAGEIGTFGSTRLDWYNASDPRPDYYRKLPSFYSLVGLNDLAEDVAEKFSGSEEARQIDWDRMYAVNQQRSVTIENANGTGESLTGRLAAYVLEEQHFDNEKYNFNTTLQASLSDRFTLSGGLEYLYENVHNYKLLKDLLGADYYIDLNVFALRDFPGNPEVAQNDLQRPNRTLEVGDRFGWDYDIVTQRAGGWMQGEYSFNQLDLFAAVELTNTSFYRNSFVQSGLFPDNSLGKSETLSFNNYGLKAGLTYKLDGRNYFYGVGTIRTRAPFSRFAFLSPRTRNEFIRNPTSETIRGFEAGYIFRYAGLKGRVSGYYTTFQDQIENNSFYNDQARTFVNFILAGVDKRHQGIELGLEAKITSTLSVDFAAALGANQYTSRPLGTYTQDNDANVIAEDRLIYVKNFYVPGPQQAYSLGLDYRSPKYWFVSLNLNHFREIYLDFNPDRRTDEAVAGLLLPDRNETFQNVIAQEKLPSQFTLDFFGGKSWRIQRDYFLNLTLGVNNILNNKGFRTGGFEQGRFDYEGLNVDRFPPRYFYAFGTTYSAGLTLRF